MIVIERNGRKTVITGWRAWLLGMLVVAVVSVVVAVIAVVVLGVALTMGTIFLALIPGVIVVALLAELFGKRSAR